MKSSIVNWSKLYQGHLSSQFLWTNDLNGINQFSLELTHIKSPSFDFLTNLRLGKIAEHFTFEYWSNDPDLKILCRNIQIEGKDRTLGEIDALIRYMGSPLHIEIAYKFYLYDPKSGSSELEHWIGPNRKDSLVSKLDRLKSQQLQLPNLPEAKDVLSKYLNTEENLDSKVWMKGQLFIPHGETINNSLLNEKCIVGTYVNHESLDSFKDSKFYLPSKLEWLSIPTTQIEWTSIHEIKDQIQPLLERNFSPMLWVKDSNDEIKKMFVTWW